MHNITLAWSFRNRFDIFKKSILTADKFCPKYINFCLIDAASDESTIRKLRILCNSISNRKIRICESAYRSTVSEAWNLGIMLSETRYVVFVSSDVEFKDSRWIKELEKMINAGYEYVLIENHAVFMIDKRIIPKLGWLDEQFSLGPHFDTDYMIRSSEAKVRFIILRNNGAYTHSDSNDVIKARMSGEVRDRLPMHEVINENYFKRKWQTSWPGWKERIHPPANIKEVKRLLLEIDPHPFYTKKYKEMYRNESLKKKALILGKRIPIKISQRLIK